MVVVPLTEVVRAPLELQSCVISHATVLYKRISLEEHLVAELCSTLLRP